MLRWTDCRADIYLHNAKTRTVNGILQLVNQKLNLILYQQKFMINREDILNTLYIKSLSLLIRGESLLVKENLRLSVFPFGSSSVE